MPRETVRKTSFFRLAIYGPGRVVSFETELEMSNLRKRRPAKSRRPICAPVLYNHSWRMNTVVLWSRAVDQKILVSLGCICVLALSGLTGVLLPSPWPGDGFRLVGGMLTTTLLVLVWGTFRLIRTVRYNNIWVVSEFVLVPVLWGLFVMGLAVWFQHLHGTWGGDYEVLHVL